MFDKLKECHQKMCILGILAAVFLIVLSVFFIFKTRNASREYGYIGRAPLNQYTVTIDAEGKVSGKPDVAVINLGVQSESATVKVAQGDNTKKMDNIIKAIKDNGVKDEDIQTTNYSIYPKYSYDQNRGTSNITGYTVSQSVTVKVRDLDKTGTILAKAGDLGANTVGGVQFTIDNPDALKAEARQKAIDNAKAKADELFKKLGVGAGRIVSFNEYSAGTGGPVYYKEAMGMGGAAMDSAAPSIQSGSLDVVVNVTLVFEIK